MSTLMPASLKRRLPLPLAGEGTIKRADDDSMTEGVYERIKTWLLSQALAPGQLLQIGVLAEELGVSTTPVREALTRLAAERLIVSAPKRGFFARTPSEDDILGLYCVNQTVLDAAVSHWPPAPPLEAGPPSADGVSRPEDVARSAAALFAQVATRSGIGELADIVRNINDRLHHARVIEAELIPESREEIAGLGALHAAGQCGELRSALKTYHEKRWQLASSICKELLLRSFLPAER